MTRAEKQLTHLLPEKNNMLFSHPFTQKLVTVMLHRMEPIDKWEAVVIAKNEGCLANDMTKDDVYASLSRAKFHVLGELIANEYETPDSVRIFGESREQAIKYWTKFFTEEV